MSGVNGIDDLPVRDASDSFLESAETDGEKLAQVMGWLKLGRAQGASDLHLKPSAPPCLRLSGDLNPIENAPVLDGPMVAAMAAPLVAGKANWRDFLFTTHELDVGVEFPDVGRLRINAMIADRQPAAAIRLIPSVIPSLSDLGLPAITASLMKRQRGLWVFTGTTGSGKTTTQAAILKAILAEQPRHVITLEDPIEFVHRHARGYVSQREIGRDTRSFQQGIISALREDPDVILVGEMRDLETIQQALRAAETGHLVLATLHAADASQLPDRIVDVFPPQQQNQIRIQLSDILLAVYAHQLVKTYRPARDGGAPELAGRVAAIEVLLGPMAELYATRAIIRKPEAGALYTQMEMNTKLGCQTMERALVELVQAGKLTEQTAREAAIKRDVFDNLLKIGAAAL